MPYCVLRPSEEAKETGKEIKENKNERTERNNDDGKE
jgi:hypothetical protein